MTLTNVHNFVRIRPEGDHTQGCKASQGIYVYRANLQPAVRSASGDGIIPFMKCAAMTAQALTPAHAAAPVPSPALAVL